MTVEMHYRTEERVEQPVFGLAIHRSDGTHITGPNTQFAGYEIPRIEGEGTVKYIIQSLPLLEGNYTISVAVRDQDDVRMYDYHDRLYQFKIINLRGRYGLIRMEDRWVHG
jgi:hypothetical protein